MKSRKSLYLILATFIAAASLLVFNNAKDSTAVTSSAEPANESEPSEQASSPSNLEASETEELHALLQQYADSADQPNVRIQAPTTELTTEQYTHLAQLAINPTVEGKLRRASLFILTHATSQHWPLLAQVAKQPLPSFPNLAKHQSLDSLAYNFEVSLRITALETLDQWASQEKQILEELLTIQDAQLDPKLLFFAQIAISGIQEGNPGKLGRFISQLLTRAL